MAERVRDGETGIIRRYFAPLAAGVDGAYDLTDDAGRIRPASGQDVVLTTDVIVGGVHFLEAASPQDVGYKALAVNVSDLCAKGADPALYLISLALPAKPEAAWLDGLSEGFAEAQAEFGCGLLGGDTVRTPGPVVISVTAAGFVPRGRMVHRFGAREGDEVYVTGTIGDAALALALLQGRGGMVADKLTASQSDYLKQRYWRPRPRTDSISLVRDHASACMDISDGLAGDFAKMCAASGTGGTINVADVPLSEAAAAWTNEEPARIEDVLAGGDDYELLMTVRQDSRHTFERDCATAGVQVTCIGYISAPGDGVNVLDKTGKPLHYVRRSYDHF
jgi:thiamine-monophosphate kinase